MPKNENPKNQCESRFHNTFSSILKRLLIEKTL